MIPPVDTPQFWAVVVAVYALILALEELKPRCFGRRARLEQDQPVERKS